MARVKDFDSDKYKSAYDTQPGYIETFFKPPV